MAAFRFRQRRTRRWWYAGVTLVAAAFFAVFFVAGAGAVSGSPSGFESGDGDMVLTSLDGNHTDWNCFVGSDNFQPGTPNPNCKVKTGASHVTADANGEVQWVPGQKFDILCPALNNGNNPPKDEFTDLTEFNEVAGNGDLFFYGSAIRSTANGNTSGDVEFNQKTGDGVTTAGCRTAGDRLVAYDFLNGGTTLSFHVLTYIDAAHPNLGGNNGTCFVKTNSMPCWGATVITVSSNLFDGLANQSPITAANNGISGSALAAQQWSEFGVNLTQALGASSNNPLPCFPQQVWESRSSGSSFVSNPQDIEFLHVSTCGSITIIKNTDPRHVSQNFSYSASGGSISPTSFKLNDQSALTISSIGTGNTTSTITTTTSNGFAVGDKVGVTISGSNSTPKVDGQYTATITGANTFTIPLNAPVTTAGTAGSVTTNTEVYPLLSAGTYTVNEGAEPSGFSPESLTCVDSNGNSTTTSGVTATIAVAANGSTVCTYVNHQNLATMATQQVSSPPVFPGNPVHDTATVTGNNPSVTPSGDVTFYLCGPLQNAAGCSSSDSTRTLVGTGTLNGSGGTASAASPNVNGAGSELDAGIYCFEATWPGDTNYPGSKDVTDPANECFTVQTIATTTVTTPSVGQGGILVGSSVTDHAVIAAVQGGGGPITGSVTFFICSPSQTVNGACPDGSGSQVSSTTQLTDLGTSPPSASADSDSTKVDSTGTWCWRAVYDPGSNHNYTGSKDASSGECFQVNPIATTTVTTPSVGPGGILVGSPVTDHAVIAAVHDGGGPITGSVTFFICSPSQTVNGACPDGSGSQVSSTTNLTDGGTTPPSASADSDSFTPHSTGTWCWRAVYDPGSNHNYTGSEDASSGECFQVNPIATTTVTTPSVGQGGILVGSPVTDHAVIAAVHDGGGPITGSVTFFICDPTQTVNGACPDGSGSQVSSTTQLTDLGTTPPSASADSDSFTPHSTGTWCWRAVYDPGSNHNYTGSKDASSGECFQVNPIATTTVTTPSVGPAGILVGSPVTDHAVIAAVHDGGGPITGSVTFFICSPSQTVNGACPDGSGSQVSSTTNLTDGGTTPPSASADSDSFTPHSTGTWCWRAVYDPGSNHNYTGSKDASSGECFQVNPIATTTVTTPSVGQNGLTTFGSVVTDHAVIVAAHDGGGAITGSVTFYICNPLETVAGACPDGSGTQVSSTTQLTDGGTTPPSASADSASVTVDATGTWCWRAVYDPGSNHNYTGSEDAGSTECFLVTDTTTSTSQQVWYPNDSASVSADSAGDTISGTLTLQLYTGADCVAGNEVSGQHYSSGDQTGKTSITVDSNKQTTFGVGSSASVSWKVVFTSDDPNVGNSSHCENSSVTITN